MGELLKLAAEIARGDYHPSHCVEDYRKGMGRVEFAAMAGDYADRLRGRVSVMKDAEKRIAELEAEVDALRNPQWPEVVRHLNSLVETEEGKALIRWHETTEEALAKAEKERDRLYAFADRMLELLWEGYSLDGSDVHETLQEEGLIEEVPGGFDPKVHVDNTGCAEPGCQWYQRAPWLAALEKSDD
jgi:hypothetical protein